MVKEPTEEKKWTIFLSHSSKDKKPFVNWLHKKLLSADLPVWYDKFEILVGDSITQKIAEGLEGSEFLIVVISRNAVKSNWVKAELEPKILQQIEGQEITVLPVVLGKIDPGEISLFLKGKRWIRFPRKGSDEKFRELLEGIEGHLERRGLLKTPRRSTGRPTLRNPFGLRGGVEPERFVEPERLVWEVTEDIAKKQCVSIVGARMIGKTSLLKFLASERCQDYYQYESGQTPALRFAYIDLQEHSGKRREQLVPELACAMSEGLPVKKKFQGNTHAEAVEWIKQTAGRSRDGRPLWVLLFDEFDRIVELNGIDKELFDELRALPQHYNLCYVIGSRRKLFDLPLPQGVSTSPFFNLSKEHFLSVWDEATARALVFKPRGKELKLFTDDDFAFMTRLTARHPLLLQIGCYHLFNARRAGGKKTVDYNQVQESYMQEAESVYRYYWDSEVDDAEREWLRDCWQAVSEGDTVALGEFQNDTPQRKNRTIRVRLAKLGFVLSESGSIEFPTGFQSFLGRFEE